MSYESLGLGVVSQQGLRERLLVLRSIDLFDGFDDPALLLLAEHAKTSSYRAGQTISEASDAARAVYVVTAGSVTVSRSAEHVTFAAGSAFGAMALLARQPLGLARADVDTRTLEIPAAAVEAAIDESFSVLRSTLRIAGAAVLKARGNLPVDPRSERNVQEGTFHDQPRSFVERLIELRSGPFGYMNVEALVDLARHMREVRMPKGQVIWSVGDASTYAFHIDYGRVRCTSSDGRHVDVGRGFTIGVLDVWGSEGRAYEALAETELIGFRVDFEDFLTLLETHVEVGIDILRGFAQSLLEQPGTGR
ncbi:MAG: cyclic nucleotide-binding domain-containing protein [Deltaproteobacteria bacterium]